MIGQYALQQGNDETVPETALLLCAGKMGNAEPGRKDREDFMVDLQLPLGDHAVTGAPDGIFPLVADFRGRANLLLVDLNA